MSPAEARWRPRWRADAGGYVARYAGQWASPETFDRDRLERLVAEMPNGRHIEIIDVTAS